MYIHIFLLFLHLPIYIKFYEENTLRYRLPYGLTNHSGKLHVSFNCLEYARKYK